MDSLMSQLSLLSPSHFSHPLTLLFHYPPDVPVYTFSGAFLIGFPGSIGTIEQPVAILFSGASVAADGLLRLDMLDENTDPQVVAR